MTPRRVVVLAGPTAVGKGTVSTYVREHYPHVWISTSATTRPPRPGEIDGVHYHFVDNARFDELVANDGLLEWAVVHGRNRYGTPAEPVRQRAALGEPVLLEIDLAGARQLRTTLPDALFVFLAPPSWDELVHRLVGRGTETPAEQAIRLETAKVEMAAMGEFDEVIVNDQVSAAAARLVSLIEAPPPVTGERANRSAVDSATRPRGSH